MSLHPDDRPASIEAFNNFLFDHGEMDEVVQPPDSLFAFPRIELFGTRIDSALVWSAAALLLVSLIATLAR